MLRHMRTTIDIPDALAEELRRHLASRRSTMREVVIEGLRRVLAAPTPPFRLPQAAFTGTVGFRPGVGADDALADLRDDPAGRGPAQR